MENAIRSYLLQEDIPLFSFIPLGACRLLRPYLLNREGISEGTVIMMAVPYATPDEEGRNISAYAAARDYHLFFRELFDRLLPALRQNFPRHRFVGFADHSPIDEVDAAVRAGLGVLGDNGLLLTVAYSSYVFLGEVITDAVLPAQAGELLTCHHCGACRRACPVALDKSQCLSALTQKKGALTESENTRLAAHPLVWGCDTCQEACPYTHRAKENGTLYSALPFFRTERLPHITENSISEMDDAAFSSRAYAWRGREVILRNLKIHR